jgi:hypothetical protein
VSGFSRTFGWNRTSYVVSGFSRTLYRTLTSYRQHNRERAAATDIAVEPNVSAVRLYDLTHHRKPDARAFDVPLERQLPAHELAEDGLLLGAWNTWTAIDNRNRDSIAVLVPTDRHDRVRRGVFDSVVHQVPQRDAKCLLVCQYLHNRVRAADLNPCPNIARLRFDVANTEACRFASVGSRPISSISAIWRTVVSGERNSWETAATKSDCRRATAASRRIARAMKYVAPQRNTSMADIIASRIQLLRASAGSGETAHT